MDIRITKLEIQDWESYRELRLRALRDEPTAFTDSLDEAMNRAADYWIGHLKAEESDSISLFAKKGKKLVGMGAVIFNSKQKKKHIAELVGVYIDKNERGQGIGSMLIQALIDVVAKQKTIKKVKLSVAATQKPAIGLYEKFGFKPIGVEKDEMFIDGKYLDTMLMEKFL